MHISLYAEDFEINLFQSALPLSGENGISENKTAFKGEFGQGYYKEIAFEGVHIGFGNVSLKDRIKLFFESDLETVEMHFALKGKSNVCASSFKNNVRFQDHQHNIVYAKGICGEMIWESKELQLCEINLSPSFFNKFLPEDNSLFEKFRTSIEKGNSNLLTQQHYHINHQMYEIIDGIMNCQRQGIFKKMYLEAKVIELLLLQLEQFSEQDNCPTSLKKKDIDKMYEVRDFMLNNISDTSSLLELAHRVGTNDFTLKKGFKEVFGTTVFGFWKEAKMEQARQLIAQQGKSVQEVAEALGYSNARHFSTAFKKTYGISPGSLKA
ncbi:MAG: AraC family transcriptional regulator [Zunongwangia sp.]|uniref:helix-turn-helix domain-containing protein n=1 Tax=Zunongwangia sp. TaxID=1965325 RepID=UPI0032424073